MRCAENGDQNVVYYPLAVSDFSVMYGVRTDIRQPFAPAEYRVATLYRSFAAQTYYRYRATESGRRCCYCIMLYHFRMFSQM